MHLYKIFEGKPGARLLPCLALCMWTDVVGAAQGQAPQSNAVSQEPIEEIEVTGRKALVSLRVDIVNAETQMFNLFNELNDVREFTISCESVMITGSRIPERSCVPYYMKWARQENVSDFLFSDINPPSQNSTGPSSGGASMDTKGVQQSEQELWFHAQPKHREFNTRFRELAAEHPELAAAALDLQTKKERLAELEARQKDGSALGRFFSGLGGKAED